MKVRSEAIIALAVIALLATALPATQGPGPLASAGPLKSAGGYVSSSTTVTLYAVADASTVQSQPSQNFQAPFLLPNTEYWAAICTSQDVDYYGITVAAGEHIRAEIWNLPADFDLDLYGPDLSLIGQSTNLGTTPEVIEHDAAASGSYYIRVYGKGGAFDPDDVYFFKVTLTGVAITPTPTATPTATATPTSRPAQRLYLPLVLKNYSFELGIPLSEVPVEYQGRAMRLLEEMRGTEMAPGWEKARLGEIVYPFYRPDIDGIAYYEFEVEPAGFITLSKGEHDFPIPHWNFTGEPIAKVLASKARQSGKRAVKFFNLGDGSYAAEDSQGELVATVGTLPLRVVGGIDPTWNEEYPLNEASAEPSENGLYEVEVSEQVPIELEEWESWNELKAGYADEYRVLLEALRRDAAEEWEIEKEIMAATAEGMGVRALGWEPWTYYWADRSDHTHEDQRDYSQVQIDCERGYSGCGWSGCGPTAWAMLFGWADHQATLGNPFWERYWGIYRLDGGYGGDADAPKVQDQGIDNITREISDYLEVRCTVSESDGCHLSLTWPKKMINAGSYLEGRATGPFRLSTVWGGHGCRRCKDKLINSIKSGRPAIVGKGFFSHYGLAYGYKIRCREFWGTCQRRFYVNEGWGGSGNGWMPARHVWFAGEMYPLAPGPNSPSNLVATAASSFQINLTWQDNSNAEDGFKIERRVEGGSYGQIAVVGPNTTTYIDSDLTPETSYCYRVRAYNMAGNSSYSNEDCTILLPLPPSNLVATVVSGTRIDLTWQDNSDIDMGFKIERKVEGGSYGEIATVGPAVTYYSDYGLIPDTTYCYRVRAYNIEGGHSDYSNESCASTLPLAPNPPSQLDLTVVSSSQIDLAWRDNSDNEDGFKIERKVLDGSYSEIAVVGPNITSYSDSGLNPKTTYCYRVRAYNAGGHSNYCLERCARTPPAFPPTPPSDLVATARSPYQINLAWQDNSDDEDGFKIERKEGPFGSYSEIARMPYNTTTYIDLGLNPETIYCYRVKAYNVAGDSSYSNESCDRTLPPVPNPPSDLVATAVSSEKIKLTWQDNSDNEDGFNIERKVEGGSYSRIGTVGADVTSYSDIGREIGGLEPGTTYCYRVRAYNAFDGSNPSNESCVTTPLGPPPTSPPEPPSDLVATAVSSGQIDLTWQDNSDNECGFKIERKVEGGSWTLIRTVGADVTSYSDTGAPTEDRLQPNTSYCYRVRAYNVVGDSSYSNGACATTPLPH